MDTSLVTGGAGFIGSHLSERLLAAGHRVFCLDNFSTGSVENVRDLLGNERFRLIETDVRLPLHFSETVDYVFHLASPASPVAYFDMPIETATANALGTYEMLKLCQRAGARFLLASTSEVYGNPLVHPQTEDYWGNVNPVGPRSSYDEGKRFAEALTAAYHSHAGTDVRITRIFNTYGPRNAPDDGRLVPNFIRQALLGIPITVYGDGSQTRSLCFVEDLVEGLIAAMMTPETAGKVFNIGSPDEHSVLQYAELIKQVCGSSSDITFCPGREEEPERRRPDISRAWRSLRWQPRTPLDKGLSRTIAWFRPRLSEMAALDGNATLETREAR